MAFDFLHRRRQRPTDALTIIVIIRLSTLSLIVSSASGSTKNSKSVAAEEDKFESLPLYNFVLSSSVSASSSSSSASSASSSSSGVNYEYGTSLQGGGIIASDVGRTATTECIDIPKNLSLCDGVGYNKMRIPNLLGHDTVYEISQQSASWIPLLNIKCHPDTRRFLCSLFCPVCLDHKIYPCRSLCEKVKVGCENRMKMYGFPWPDMFSCKLFPKDNDMCITSELVTNATSEIGNQCKICEQSSTVENILDSYCQSTIALRAKLKKTNSSSYFTFKKVKVFKGSDLMISEMFTFYSTEKCCESLLRPNHGVYFIIGSLENDAFKPMLIVPWLTKHSKSFKKAVKMLRTLNCSDPDNITHSVIINSPMVLPYATMKSVTLTKHRRIASNATSAGKRTSRRKKHKRKNATNRNINATFRNKTVAK